MGTGATCHKSTALWTAEPRLYSTGTLHPCILLVARWDSQVDHPQDGLCATDAIMLGTSCSDHSPSSPAAQGVFSAPDHPLKWLILQQLVFEHVREDSAEILSKG